MQAVFAGAGPRVQRTKPPCAVSGRPLRADVEGVYPVLRQRGRRLRSNSNGCSEAGADTGAVCGLGLGIVLTGGSDGVRTEGFGGVDGDTRAARALGLGIVLTGGSDGARTEGFGGVDGCGKARAAGFDAAAVGARDVPCCAGFGGTGDVRETGLGMEKARILWLGLSTAFR
jgi:hypothetical protein